MQHLSHFVQQRRGLRSNPCAQLLVQKTRSDGVKVSISVDARHGTLFSCCLGNLVRQHFLCMLDVLEMWYKDGVSCPHGFHELLFRRVGHPQKCCQLTILLFEFLAVCNDALLDRFTVGRGGQFQHERLRFRNVGQQTVCPFLCSGMWS